MSLVYFQTSERPEAILTLPDGLDVSSGTGYTFTLRFGKPGQPAVLEKTAGFVGGVGFATVVWEPGELDIDPGLYVLQLIVLGGATLERVYQTSMRIKPIILPAAP